MIRVNSGRALFAGVYMAGIFVLSSLSATEIAGLGLPAGLLDLGHVPLFAGLAAVTLWALVGPSDAQNPLTLLVLIRWASSLATSRGMNALEQ